MRSRKPFPDLAESIALTLLFIVMLLLSPIIIGWFIKEPAGDDYGIFGLLRYTLVVITVFTAGYYYKHKSVNPAIYPFKPIGILPLLASITALCSIIYVTDSIGYLVPMSDDWKKEFEYLVTPNIYIVIAACILAPVFEEFIFRGIILDGLMRRYRPGTAIVISSLLFGIMHLNIWQFVGAGADGLLYGWMYVRSRSIMPSIMLHAVKNISSTVAGYYFGFSGTTLMEDLGGAGYLTGLIVAAIVLMGCMRYLNRGLGKDSASTTDLPM